MMKFLSQMVKLPFTAFVYGMDMFARTLQELQKIADRNIDAMLGGTVEAPGGRPENPGDLMNDETRSGFTQIVGEAPGSQSDLASDTTTSLMSGASKDSVETTRKEARAMRDTDLSDHKMLKLVRYKILFIGRKYEVAFPEEEELIADDTTDTAYTAWKVAQFIQDLAKHQTKIPKQWGDKYPPAEYRKGDILLGFPPEDKKFLRVYFEVLDRYQREKLHKEERRIDNQERQIKVLEEIRDGFYPKKTGSTGTGSAKDTGST